jgi:hypothetical protein
MKIPLVLKVSSKKDLYKRLVAIVQCLLPDERKLTTSEIDVFSHILAKSNFHSQFNDKNRKVNVKELALTDSAFAMHRARIAKKGWIVDKLPDKFIYKVYKEVDNEIEFSIKIKIDG